MPTTRYGLLPFKEAISFFENKLNLPTERWTDIWRDGHNSGFMLAGALKDDLLNDFRRAVDSAIAEGKSIQWFKKEFKTIVAKHGWSHTGDANWRAKVIYDTNMRQSYNAGRYEQLQHFDFWEYQHGDSRYPRPMHLAWNGLILPKNHAWWKTHFPQNGWGCKCKVRGRTAKQLERQGKKVKLPPKTQMREWTDKVTGEVHKIPKGIDPGFDYAPKKGVVKQQQKKISVDKAKPFAPSKRIVPTAFSTVKTADIHSLNVKLAEFNTAKPQVDKLSEFLQQQNIKTLFIKASEIAPRSKASNAIANDIHAYLGLNNSTIGNTYNYPSPHKVYGFTQRDWQHVVVKVKNGIYFKQAKINEMINAVELAVVLAEQGNRQHTFSHIVRNFTESKAHSGSIITWLHELGHQVHYKVGMPAIPNITQGGITRYSMTNHYEWHAEHFVAWLLNRKVLAQWNEEVALYFDQLIEKAIKWQP